MLPSVLKELMRHSSVTTTEKFYIQQNAESTADTLWSVVGNSLGNSQPVATPQGRKQTA